MRIASVALAAVLILTQCAAAQETDSTFRRFRVLLTNGERHEGKTGRLTETGLEGTKENGEGLSVPFSDIRALDVSRGSEAGKYAAIGAGIGLLTSLSAALAASATAADDPWLEFNDSAAIALTAGMTVAGGLIGWAVGASQQRWERVPIGTSQAFERRPAKGVCILRVPF